MRSVETVREAQRDRLLRRVRIRQRELESVFRDVLTAGSRAELARLGAEVESLVASSGERCRECG